MLVCKIRVTVYNLRQWGTSPMPHVLLFFLSSPIEELELFPFNVLFWHRILIGCTKNCNIFMIVSLDYNFVFCFDLSINCKREKWVFWHKILCAFTVISADQYYLWPFYYMCEPVSPVCCQSWCVFHHHCYVYYTTGPQTRYWPR